MIEFNSQICTNIGQSERLLSLGLKVETADMHMTNMSSKGINYTDDWQIGSIPYCNAISIWNSQGMQLEKTSWSIIPVWSLHRLIEMIPSFIDIGEHSYMFSIIQGKLFSYGSDIVGNAFLYGKGSVYDSAIYTIEWLIKEGHFNKDYLKK